MDWYSRLVETSLGGMDITVVDLINWLSSLPPGTHVPSDVLFRYNYDLNELSISLVEAL